MMGGKDNCEVGIVSSEAIVGRLFSLSAEMGYRCVFFFLLNGHFSLAIT